MLIYFPTVTPTFIVEPIIIGKCIHAGRKSLKKIELLEYGQVIRISIKKAGVI